MPQIIVRARQSHLIKNYLSELAASPSPLSSPVLQEVAVAWTAYFVKAFATSLPPTLTGDDFASAEAAWAQVQELATDSKWVEAQKAANEKFPMYFAAVQVGYAALKQAQKREAAGSTALADAEALVEANKDAVGLWLDKQVRPPPCARTYDQS
jgi:cysteinyl-tRNA synthetase